MRHRGGLTWAAGAAAAAAGAGASRLFPLLRAISFSACPTALLSKLVPCHASVASCAGGHC